MILSKVQCIVCGCQYNVDIKTWYDSDILFHLCDYCLKQVPSDFETIEYIKQLNGDIKIKELYKIIDHWLFLEQAYQPKE